jgi:hypothetical protein
VNRSAQADYFEISTRKFKLSGMFLAPEKQPSIHHDSPRNPPQLHHDLPPQKH